MAGIDRCSRYNRYGDIGKYTRCARYTGRVVIAGAHVKKCDSAYMRKVGQVHMYKSRSGTCGQM